MIDIHNIYFWVFTVFSTLVGFVLKSMIQKVIDRVEDTHALVIELKKDTEITIYRVSQLEQKPTRLKPGVNK